MSVIVDSSSSPVIPNIVKDHDISYVPISTSLVPNPTFDASVYDHDSTFDHEFGSFNSSFSAIDSISSIHDQPPISLSIRPKRVARPPSYLQDYICQFLGNTSRRLPANAAS